jgi:hypothetical protein
VVADASGHWEADFDSIGCDITEDTEIDVDAIDPDRDSSVGEPPGTTLRHLPPNATIDACDANDWISVHNFPPNAQIRVELRNASNHSKYLSEEWTTDPDGEAFIDGRLLGFQVEIGDWVYVVDLNTQGYKALTLIDATMDTFDVQQDVISGTAPPGQYFMVVAGDSQRGSAERWVTAGADARWTADFSLPPAFDFDQYFGSTGFIYDPEGDGTIVQLPPQPAITASVNMGFWAICGLLPNAPIQVQFFDEHGDPLPPVDDYLTDSQGCQGRVEPDSTRLYYGNSIQVSDGETTKWLILEPASVDAVSASTATMTGTAPAGRRVRASTPACDLDVDTDENGVWEAHFDGGCITPEMVLDPTTPFTVFLIDEDFDAHRAFYEPDADGDGVLIPDDECPAESALGFDADLNGCIDTPQELVQIITTLPDDALSHELVNSLVSKVEGAIASQDRQRDEAAVNALNAFIHEIQAQAGKKISPEAAALLIQYAENLIELIEPD